MVSLINIGVNGLHAHQSALNTTGNNITNANTPGYSRQRTEFATLPEQRAGAGYQGQGSAITGIARIVDQFLVNQLRTDTASFHYADTLNSQFMQLDSLLADASTGVAPAMQSFFDSLQQASLDPRSVPVRQVVLSTANTLAERFTSLHGQLQSQERVINEQLAGMSGQVTSLAQGIASLNQQISQQTGGGAQPNALIDKRDELARELSELVNITVVDQGNSMVNVFIGNGQPLVVGNQAGALTAGPSASDASRYQVNLVSGGTSREVGQFLAGGEIGGLLKYRSEGLDATFNRLGQLALSIGQTFNAMQQQGMDLDGNYGVELTAVFGDINTQSLMAARSAAASSNTSAAKLNVEIVDATKLTASNYRAFYDGSGWAITTEPGGEGPYNEADLGFRLHTVGGVAPDAGDSFLIRPTRQGASSLKLAVEDPRDLALALPPVRVEAASGNSGHGRVEVSSAAAPDMGRLAAVAPLRLEVGTDINGDPIPKLVGEDGLDLELPASLLTGDAVDITLRYDGTAYSVGIDQASYATASGDFLQFSFAGSLGPGDGFDIALYATPNGTSDNSNALAMLDARFEAVVGAGVQGGGQTFADSYGSLVSSVGTRTAELNINQDAASSILAQAQANRDATSGVNLDEEAANLIRFEQAYNASAQVISVARSLFDSLLSAFR